LNKQKVLNETVKIWQYFNREKKCSNLLKKSKTYV